MFIRRVPARLSQLLALACGIAVGVFLLPGTSAAQGGCAKKACSLETGNCFNTDIATRCWPVGAGCDGEQCSI